MHLYQALYVKASRLANPNASKLLRAIQQTPTHTLTPMPNDDKRMEAANTAPHLHVHRVEGCVLSARVPVVENDGSRTIK